MAAISRSDDDGDLVAAERFRRGEVQMSEVFDVVIEGANVVTVDGIRRADVAIDGERISAVLSPGTRPGARRRIDASGLHMLPGLIDTHVHIRDPARPDRETFTSGTAAAAVGGITTVCEMPTSEPPVNTGERLRARAAAVAPRALVDFAMYAGAAHSNLDAVGDLARAGAVAFKTWLHSPAAGREAEFDGLSCPDTGELVEVMRAVASTGLVHALHCEHDEILKQAAYRARRDGGTPGATHAASRPLLAEDASVALVLALAENTGSRIQVVHVSSPRAVRRIAEARRSGIKATVETAPHYLTLTDEQLLEYGPFAKCNPPLRDAGTVEELWRCVQEGLIDVIGSDHCPYLREELMAGERDIFASPPGLPGLETMLPSLLTSVAQGRITLPHLVSLTSTRAAELFSLKQKGHIGAGYDADLVLVDLTSRWTYEPDSGVSKAASNARYFKGQEFTGRTVATWLRGREIYADDRLLVDPGTGRFVAPSRP
jgi:allantoinase